MKIKQSGSASIEFVIGFMAFWFMCMAWVEMSYMSYISAVNDLAISEISRSAKKSNGMYLNAVKEILHRENSIWNIAVSSDDFKVAIHYLPSMTALEDVVEGCEVPEGWSIRECGEEMDNAIAIYRIDYKFQPIFSYVFSRTANLSREMIVVQENERSKFEI